MPIISKEIIEYSLRGMRHRKMRSTFTIISIMIGIIAIFILISFGIGLYQYVEKYSSTSSADKITIMPKGYGGMGFEEEPSFSEEDLRAVERTSGVYSVTPISYGVAEISQDKTKKYAFLIAYDPSKEFIMAEISGIKIYKGRELKPDDKGKVVLGYNFLIKDKIMPKPYDINSEIEIQGKELRVVGFYEQIGNPQDDSQIYITDEYFKELYPNKTQGYDWIFAKVDVSKIDDVIKKCRRLTSQIKK